eukprot:gene3297-3802_t
MAFDRPLSASMFTAAVLALAVSSAAASRCPKDVNTCQLPTNDAFNLTAYVGRWYEQARSNAFPQDHGCSCVTATYEDHGGWVGVDN